MIQLPYLELFKGLFQFDAEEIAHIAVGGSERQIGGHDETGQPVQLDRLPPPAVCQPKSAAVGPAVLVVDRETLDQVERHALDHFDGADGVVRLPADGPLVLSDQCGTRDSGAQLASVERVDVSVAVVVWPPSKCRPIIIGL